jgi:HK97 family phage major capsid protein
MDHFEDMSPGVAFVRYAIAKAVATKRQVDAGDYAATRWGRGANITRIVKSAVSGGESSAGSWSGLTDLGAASREFLDAVAPMTILGKLQNLRRVPARAPIVTSAGSAIAYWVGESKAIPLSPAAFARSTMDPLKIACLVVVSNDLLANESPEGEALIRRDLLRAVAVLSDTAFIDPTSAGSAGVSPASVTHGATVVPSGGDLSDDLAQAIDAFHGDLASAAWIMSPRMAARIAFATGGRGLGAGLGLRGGELLGLPAYVSASSPSTTDGSSLALVDPTNVVAVDEGAQVDLARSAAVEMDNSPTGATDTPTAATTTHIVSLFQEDASALRVTRRVNWAANPGAVVVITSADYAAA